MPDLAVLGDENSIMLFKAFGAATFAVKNKKEAIEELNKIIAQNYSVVLIADDLQPFVKDTLAGNEEQVYLFIPPIRESTEAGQMELEEIINKTVGAKY